MVNFKLENLTQNGQPKSAHTCTYPTTLYMYYTVHAYCVQPHEHTWIVVNIHVVGIYYPCAHTPCKC